MLLDFTIRDIIVIGSLVVTLALSYGRLKSEIRHLKDTKADKRELDQLSREIRTMIAEVRLDIARLAETVRYSSGLKEKR